MTMMTIGEVAERSGFSPSTLRYYERIGLVRPVTRSGAGYRLYDDGTLDRLAWIGRAKRIGCSLGEIADLAAALAGERCASAQQRLHRLVGAKLEETEQQLAMLTDHVATLKAAAAQLAARPAEGACHDECACATALEPPAPTLQPLASEAAIGCTLDRRAMRQRAEQWAMLLDQSTDPSTTPDGAFRYEFGPGVDPAELVSLVVAEQRCCSFLGFAITFDASGPALVVHVPPDAPPEVAALFGVRIAT